MKTHLSPEQIKTHYKKIRFYYYLLLPISLFPIGLLCLVLLYIPDAPIFIHVLLILAFFIFHVARIFIARCPVCGWFLFPGRFLILLYAKCPYCKTQLTTGELSNI